MEQIEAPESIRQTLRRLDMVVGRARCRRVWGMRLLLLLMGRLTFFWEVSCSVALGDESRLYQASHLLLSRSITAHVRSES